MSSHSASDGPGRAPDFACHWLPTGVNGATVRVTGDLDSITAPQARQIVDGALDHARLVVIDLRAVSFVDSSGLRLLLGASRRARACEARLVLLGPSAAVERLFELTATRALVDVIPLAVQGTETVIPIAGDGIDPLANPVNARIVRARVMDIDDRALWTRGADGTIRRAWTPQTADGSLLPASAQVEIYLDQRGVVNGWWHIGSRVAINQRHLDAVDGEPDTATGALLCQGACQLLWQAPAASHVLQHHERCLTCAGHLVLV